MSQDLVDDFLVLDAGDDSIRMSSLGQVRHPATQTIILMKIIGLSNHTNRRWSESEECDDSFFRRTGELAALQNDMNYGFLVVAASRVTEGNSPNIRL